MSGEISTFRLYLLRSVYLLMAVGLGIEIWPALLGPTDRWQLPHGIIMSMLGALGALSLLGLRYPLAMLPLLFFELTWKTIWLIKIALPLWLQHRLGGGFAETAGECLLVVVVPIAIPWDHVWSRYLRLRGDRWWGRPAQRPAS
jgi:hypothetical protein